MPKRAKAFDRASNNTHTSSLWPIFIPFLVFVLHSTLFITWLIDDAGISFAYGRNFIHGHGLVAQPGVEPVEGFSNPLWTILLSPLFITDPVNPTVSVKLISFTLIFCSFTLISKMFRHLFMQSEWSGYTTVAVLLFLSMNTSFVVWTTSGLENPLYAFLLSLYSLQIVMYATGSSRWPHASLSVYAGLSAASLALTRPDGIVFLAAFPCLLAIMVTNDWSEWKSQIRRLFLFLISAFAPITAYSLFRYSYFGDLFPNTYHVKIGSSFQDFILMILDKEAYLDKTYDLLSGVFQRGAIPVLVLFVLGFAHFLLKRRKTPAVFALFSILACSWILYCLLPSDWMGEYRFATPFILLFSIAIFALIADALKFSSFSLLQSKIVFFATVLLILLNSVAVYLPRSIQFAQSPPAPFDVVARRYGLRFNEYADRLGIQEASLLAPDLGGTLYFSRHRVYDLSGLCDRNFAPLINADNKAKLRDHVFDLRPTFIHVNAFWDIYANFHDDERFSELYATLWETYSDWAEMEGYSGFYSGDYVLKNAVNSPEALARLKDNLQQIFQEKLSPSIDAQPFPRG